LGSKPPAPEHWAWQQAGPSDERGPEGREAARRERRPSPRADLEIEQASLSSCQERNLAMSTTIPELRPSDLPAPPKPPDDHGALRERWSQVKRLAFREMGPAALCIVATDGPVSVVTYDAAGNVKARFGHNRGCWPARVAVTGQWEDRIGPAYDRNPFVATGVQIRVWAETARQRDRLVLPAAELLGAMAEEALGAELRAGFVDLGPEVRFELLEMELHAMAERLGVIVWDDEGLSRFLDECLERAQALMELRR
jgi:hypothetical protein